MSFECLKLKTALTLEDSPSLPAVSSGAPGTGTAAHALTVPGMLAGFGGKHPRLLLQARVLGCCGLRSSPQPVVDKNGKISTLASLLLWWDNPGP